MSKLVLELELERGNMHHVNKKHVRMFDKQVLTGIVTQTNPR